MACQRILIKLGGLHQWKKIITVKLTLPLKKASTAMYCIVVLYLKFEKVTRWGGRHPFGCARKESLQICMNINLLIEALTSLGVQNSL